MTVFSVMLTLSSALKFYFFLPAELVLLSVPVVSAQSV